MKYYGKVLFNGVPASGLRVSLLNTTTGAEEWSGLTTPHGFFFADVVGETELVASVAGEFDTSGAFFQPMAQALQSISKERIVSMPMAGWLAVLPYSNSLGVASPKYGSVPANVEVMVTGGVPLAGEALSAFTGHTFLSCTDALLPFSYGKTEHIATLLTASPFAYSPVSDTVEAAPEVAWVTHLLGKIDWKDVPYNVTTPYSEPDTFRLNIPSNLLKQPYVIDRGIVVTQTAAQAESGTFFLYGAPAGSPSFSGINFHSAIPGTVKVGYVAARRLAAVDGSLFPTLGIASTYEVFLHTPYSGWVKDFDLPVPVVAGNTENDPAPVFEGFLPTGMNYNGVRYMRKGHGYNTSTLFSVSELAYSESVPSGLSAMDADCPVSANYCMYQNHRAMRFSVRLVASPDYEPQSVFDGVDDYDFVTDTNTLHPMDGALLAAASLYNRTGLPLYSCTTFIVGSKLYIPRTNALLLEYDIVTNTVATIPDPNPTNDAYSGWPGLDVLYSAMVPSAIAADGDMYFGDYDNRAMASLEAGAVLSYKANSSIVGGGPVEEAVNSVPRHIFATHF